MLTLAVPVYNMESYLPRCMDALLHQTCKDFEILLIDDGSVDGSATLCDNYALRYPEQVRVLHKENGGLSSARNAGIDHANGTHITFPDPDDWAEPNYVEKLLSLQKEHGADLVCTGYYVDFEDRTVPANPDIRVMTMSGTAAQRALLLPPQIGGFAWNKLYRLDIIREHGFRFLDNVGITEDLDFAYRYLAFCQTVCYAPGERSYHYFQRDGAATNSGFSLHKLESLRTYEKIIADCEASDPELARAAEDELCTAAVNLIWMYENSGKQNLQAKKYLLQQIRRYLPVHLKSTRYGPGRKFQAILAGFCPKLYRILKNAVHK